MTISIWRFSHLMLAIVASVFIALASITGVILAFEPVANQLQPYAIHEDISLASTLENLSESYDEIITVETDENDFVIASVITKEGNSEKFYINPENGKKVGDLIEKAPIFKFATNLHRSLFLKSTGRCVVGVMSFFLILIAITGIVLIAKRQGGITRFFSKVINENVHQYYHVVLGRLFLIPVLIVALTGVYLSLEKFSLLPETKIAHTYPTLNADGITKAPIRDFEIFNSLKISNLKRLEFPFSDDIEDFFFVKLNDKELLINQYTGDIVSEQKYPLVQLMSQWSLVLHTGQGTLIWAIVLAIVCLALVFFIYSGFSMTLKRVRFSKRPNNVYDKDDAEYIVLVGTETGSTNKYATLFYKALLATGKRVFISQLDEYTVFCKATHLVVFTSTYGEGEAPSNAKNFHNLLKNNHQNHTINFSVVGFGSLLYTDYCKFAEKVDSWLSNQKNFERNLELFKINNQSFDAFKHWVLKWNEKTSQSIIVEQPTEKLNSKYTRDFKVINRTELNIDQTFLLRLRPLKKIKFQSGDLLSFKPNKDEAVRQYSIAKIENDILLSIKKHENGLCSTFLSLLNIKDTITATVDYNPEFHLPSLEKDVVLIANGTGIAPFLGMITSNTSQQNIHLFWGGRTKESLKLYSGLINDAKSQKKLTEFHIAYSQETATKGYVQDMLLQHKVFLANHLKNEGIIMLCGSVSMQNKVLELLNTITSTYLNEPLSTFESNDQLLMDCY